MSRTTIKIALADLPHEYKALPKRDEDALIAAARQTVLIDAPRWIQWSIRGGGTGAQPTETTTKPRPRKPRAKGKKPSSSGVLSKALGKVRSWFKKPKDKPKVRKPARKKKKAGARTSSSGYRPPIYTGDYANSWVAEPTETGAKIYSGASPAVKAGVIELGRRPGKGIPLEPLTEWVRKKLNVPNEKQARSIAFAISKAQKERGRKGLHVMRRAHPMIAKAMQKNAKRMMVKFHRKASSRYKAAVSKLVQQARSQ